MQKINGMLHTLLEKYEEYMSACSESVRRILESIHALKDAKSSPINIRRRYEIFEHVIFQNRFIDQELANLEGINNLLERSCGVLSNMNLSKQY